MGAVDGRGGLWRSRWAAVGAAIAVSLGAGGLFVAQAQPGPSESTIVTVTPERILDTRDPNNVGLGGPFVSAIAQKLQVTGSIPTATGTKIVVPAGATGVLLNVTPVNPTAAGFISIRPGDATGAATTSSLNFTTGIEGIVPNAVQVAVPTTGTNAGEIDITYDAYGVAGPTTDILIDVVGYMTSAGLQQLVADVAAKANAADVYTKTEVENLVFDGTIPSAVTVTGNLVWDSHGSTNAQTDRLAVAFPGRAPVPLVNAKVNFDQPGVTGDGDPQCTGSVLAPTAPAGKVCIYLDSMGGMAANSLFGLSGYPLTDAGFMVEFTPNGTDDVDQFVYASWAYTAP